MTYEYKCRKCGLEYELLGVKLAERDIVRVCGDCGGICERVEIAPLGTIYRCRGFYETDYKRKNPE